MPQLQNLADVENPKVNEKGHLVPVHQATMISGQV